MDSQTNSSYFDGLRAHGPMVANPANDYLEPIEAYKDSVSGSFPELPRAALDNCSMFPVDALALGYFLEHYPRDVTALEVGAFVGVSAFFLASHPKVTNVMSVDPNLPIAEELTANSNIWRGNIALEELKEIKALDVAKRALEEFDLQRQKIQFLEGVVGTNQVGAKGNTVEELEVIEVPELEQGKLIGIIDGLHTKDGVRRDLEALFARNPHAIAFLDDCRHRWGPLVQAGAVEFMEQAETEYKFRMLGDISTGLASSNFGILYPVSAEREISGTLSEVSDVFSERLDPLRLLSREEELITIVNEVRQERDQNKQQVQQAQQQAQQAQQQLEKLKQDVDHLRNHYASQRYKLADTVIGNAVKIPAVKNLRGLVQKTDR